MFGDNSGYVMKRRAILRHLSDAKMTPTEFLIFDLLLLMADSDTGVCMASAEKIVAYSGSQLNKRTVQDALVSLSRKGYIKRGNVKGKRGNYPVCVDKYLCTTGQNRGKRVLVGGAQAAHAPRYEVVLLRTEEMFGSDSETTASTVAAQDLRTETVLTPYRDRTETVPVQYTIKKTQEAPAIVTAAASSEQRIGFGPESTAVDQSEVVHLIEACYDLANKNSKHSEKNNSKATELLAANKLDYLLVLIAWAKKDDWWRKAFKESAYPVNFFAKTLSQIEEQHENSRPRHPSSRKPPLPAQQQTGSTCPLCKGRGAMFSPLMKADLPCVCAAPVQAT